MPLFVLMIIVVEDFVLSRNHTGDTHTRPEEAVLHKNWLCVLERDALFQHSDVDVTERHVADGLCLSALQHQSGAFHLAGRQGIDKDVLYRGVMARPCPAYIDVT